MLDLLKRQTALFEMDLANADSDIRNRIADSRFLVIGGAGTIGQAVVKEIFKRGPRLLHVADINENNMVELVRDIRSSFGYGDGEFQTFIIDYGSADFEAFCLAQGCYDYVLNLSALKHVRSEQDPFTLMRMIEVNILNVVRHLESDALKDPQKYFCVSTDKAANPVNMMGASKRIMEMFLMAHSQSQSISTARFANVAFSDGSLLHGFTQRIGKRQPLSAPLDVKRYFVTPEESGQLCLLSCLLGENRDIFFPKLDPASHQLTFAELAVRYLEQNGYEPYICDTEEEARQLVDTLVPQKKWPCHFFVSDTTGEKDEEEFFLADEKLDLDQFASIGIVKNELAFDQKILTDFISEFNQIKQSGVWSREALIALFHKVLPNFNHRETGKYLNQRM
ncbi:MAG: UDP-N-acetylglucosamine 4,6-dehydratase [Parvibaculales bacterium]